MGVTLSNFFLLHLVIDFSALKYIYITATYEALVKGQTQSKHSVHVISPFYFILYKELYKANTTTIFILWLEKLRLREIR